MPRLLPPVLSPLDLPEAELCAARLDGELVPIGECFGCVDEIVDAHHRGASLAALLPPRLIAERMTAAWVLGATEHRGRHWELCADAAARYRCAGRLHITVREVVVDDSDVEMHGGMRVTTPLRTALDIARIPPASTPDQAQALSRLAAIGAFTLTDALAALQRRRHLPDKRRAADRLRFALSPR